MGTFGQKLDNAAAGALCAGLDVAGEWLLGAGAVSLAFGGTGVVPLSLGAAALMASQAGCNWDPDAPGPAPSGEGQIGGCTQVATKAEVIFKGQGPNQPTSPPLEWRQLNKAIFTGIRNDGRYTYTLEGLNGSGSPTSQDGIAVSAEYVPGYFSLASDASNPCTDDQPIPPTPDPEFPPYTYTDPDDGCQLIVNWKGLATDNHGHVSPVFKIEPSAETRAGGGIIGGCNFSPVIYTGPPSGPPDPPIVGPWDPDWDIPGGGDTKWEDFLRDLAAGLIGEATYNLIESIFDTPYDGTIYRAVSVCEKNAEGQPVSEAVEVLIPPASASEATLTRLDAIVELLQAHKNFKQPICANERPELKGNWRTISFRSQESSPYGKSCLRKRFRYRSLSGIGLGELVDHWKDFTFQSGPVIVSHKGHTWGTPQVWANSVDEGKRVIQHAAREAGFDANQVGEWGISNSSSPRYGVSLPMKIDTTGGYYWITARDGSSERPIIALTSDP
jgi:hypothetical protein